MKIHVKTEADVKSDAATSRGKPGLPEAGGGRKDFTLEPSERESRAVPTP